MSEQHKKFQLVVNTIITALEQNLQVVIQAAKDAHFAATHAESVAETKYDTFGLESSYLAQGQQKRVDEVNQALAYFLQLPTTGRQIPVQIASPCIVLLENDTDSRQFFVAPHAGGLTVEIEKQSLTIVTPATPVGQTLIGKELDDEVSIIVKGQMIDFEVVEIY